jgi:hypothetical protein
LPLMAHSGHDSELEVQDLFEFSGYGLDHDLVGSFNYTLRVGSYVRPKLWASLATHEDPHRAPPARSGTGGVTPRSPWMRKFYLVLCQRSLRVLTLPKTARDPAD